MLYNLICNLQTRQDWNPAPSVCDFMSLLFQFCGIYCSKKKGIYKTKTETKKTEGKKEKVHQRIRTRHHLLCATSPYHYTTMDNCVMLAKSLPFNTRITNVFVQPFSSYFKAIGPNRFHFLCTILLPSICIAKSTFLTAF